MRTTRLLLALSVFGVLAVGACVSNTNPYTGASDLDAGLFPVDGALPTFDGGSDAGLPACVTNLCISLDASHADSAEPVADANQPDTTAADANVADTSVTDTSVPEDTNVADTNVADTSVTDANVADTSIVDASIADTNVADTNVADTNVPDVFDAGCVASVFGDYYIRTDGTAVSTLVNAVVYDNSTSAPLKTLTAIVEQQTHACGLRNDGTVWCWPYTTGGGNTNGDLGNGATGGNQTAYYATQVVTQPLDAGPEVYLTGVTSISTHSQTVYDATMCAIRSDRTVWCWGNSTAQGSPPDGLFWGTTGSESGIPYAIPMALTANDAGPTSTIMADQIVVGDRHACYLDNGKVYCWGQNVAGNLGTGDTLFRAYPAAVVTGLGLPATVDAISAGFDLSCALASGQVWCWGTNSLNEIGNPNVAQGNCNSNFCQPVPTPVQMTLPDGGVLDSGGPDPMPLTGASQLTGGYQAICVLVSGDIWCWGAKNAGSSDVPAATMFKQVSGAPYTNVTSLSNDGEDMTSLHYLTADGTLVGANQVVTPICP